MKFFLKVDFYCDLDAVLINAVWLLPPTGRFFYN